MKNPTPHERIKRFENRQYIFSLIGLLILTGLSIIANTLHLQSVAEQNARFISRMIKVGDFREVSLTLEEARLSNFVEIEYKSQQPGRSFTLPPLNEFQPKKSLTNIFVTERIEVLISDFLSSSEPDIIVFEYNRYRLIPYAFLIWIILNLVLIPQTRFMKKRLLEQFEQDLIAEGAILRSEIAKNVRHNLRTPLAALLRIPARLPAQAKNEKELLESIISQIKSLISKLDTQENKELSEGSSFDLFDSLLKAKQELALALPKRIDFHFEIADDVVSAKVSHIPSELRTVMGNLVNNSAEAISGNGTIRIMVYDLGHEVKILVQDNGSGVSDSIVQKVFEKGFSFGKINGTGLGLSHAQDWIKSWNGQISIESQSEKGTVVSISLPVSDRTSWYVPRLKFSKNSQIVILEDQESARHLWKHRIAEAGISSQTQIFADPNDLNKIDMDNPSRYTFLFDYDLQATENGLELLKQLPIESTRVLVTGHFDVSSIREECSKENIFLLAKSQISDLPFVIV